MKHYEINLKRKQSMTAVENILYPYLHTECYQKITVLNTYLNVH